jgi:tubulin polyglutamylase TTLL6/13
MSEDLVVNIANTQYDVVQEIASELKWKVNSDLNDLGSDVYWQDNALTPDELTQLKPYQRINHFPGMYTLARKDHLGKNLKAMRSAYPNQYNFFPPTWILPKDLQDLKAQFNPKRAKTFICKPEALSQGKGIFLTRNLEEIPEKCVVQRYLHKPYLIDGLKFDLRVYVLILGCDPLRLYIHKEGLVRLATEVYIPPTTSNLGDICMHLTNYAINKNSSKFEFNQNKDETFKGHKRSLSAFMQKLAEDGHDTPALWADIGKIVLKTVCIAQPLLSHLYRSSQPNDLTNSICFQILGFDIFLDYKLKPYLLEVNHTPSFTTDTPLDSVIKKDIIGDALRMLGLNHRLESFKVTRNNKGIREMRVLRNEVREKWMNSRAEIEEKFKGGYTRLFPADDSQEYEEFMTAARDVWLSNLGIKKRKETNAHTPAHLPQQVVLKPINTPKTYHKSSSPLLYKKLKNIDSQNKKSINKLPALKLAYGYYIQPRLFGFSDSGSTILPICRDQEKQG